MPGRPTGEGRKPFGQGPIPFPAQTHARRSTRSTPSPGDVRPEHSAGDDVLEAFDAVSRRITDLARELKCLGYFEDDNSGRPRAA